MKEIKFRFWDKELEEMQYQSLHDLAEGEIWFDGETDSWWALYDSHNEQKRFVALQYTGYQDTNEADIYVGDIVEFCDFASEITGGYAKSNIHRAIVRFENGSFMVENEDYWDYLGQAVVNDSELKIVGNIYEGNR